VTNDQPERLWPEEWQRGPRFAGAYSFMRLPLSRDLSKADVVIVGLPYDGGVNRRPGARYGPRAIRAASEHVRAHPFPEQPLWGPLQTLRVIDYGDLDISSPYIDYALGRIEELMSPVYAAGVVPIALGGDHTTSLPLLRAAAKTHGPLSLLHFDAHPDFWKPDDPARPYHHGTPFYHAAQEGLIRVGESIQVGIRGSVSAAIVDEVRAAGMHLFTADEFAELGVRGMLAEIYRVVKPPIYLSLDIDCADPAFAPGTGTPEVAGLSSRELMALVRGLRGLPIVGFDVVEVSPPFDASEITAILAANLVLEFLELIAAQRADPA
jgi:agmatinase/guanidinopropionase